MKARLIKETMYENEAEQFANRMYTLENELEELNPQAWRDFERETGTFWRKYDSEDWLNAFGQDMMGCYGFEEELRSLISMSK